ncbi:MAG: DUF971 domain-containing protein [Pseudomonadota bacterium]
MPAPLRINYRKASRRLVVSFQHAEYELAAEYLRVESPSAEVQGHGGAGAQLQSGKKQVAITDIIATGNYGIRLVFSDGHDSGIYSWSYLDELGRDYDARWQTYLQALRAAGQTREPLIARQFDPNAGEDN